MVIIKMIDEIIKDYDKYKPKLKWYFDSFVWGIKWGFIIFIWFMIFSILMYNIVR